MPESPSKQEFINTIERIRTYVIDTPILRSSTFDDLCSGQLFFKCENLQKVGAFKYRGATNFICQLDNIEIKKGIVTASSGNHAQAVSLAAKIRSVPAYIVMPENAPKVKINAVEGYGGQITYCKPDLEDRKKVLREVAEQTGAYLIPAYDDYGIIAGQGTAAIELFQKTPILDYILAPVGGGGLISGTAMAAYYFSPKTKVIGCEPETADDATQTFRKGEFVPSNNPITIADGLLTSLGEKNTEILLKHVSDMVTVTEKEIVAAMLLVWERMKIIIEPSSAVPVAAVLSKKLNVEGKKVGIILSGGNVDLQNLPWLKQSE